MRDIERYFDHWFGKGFWSTQSFERCLQIAFIYPIFLFLLAWLLGGSGVIGASSVLPDAAFNERLIGFVAVIVSAGFLFWFFQAEIPERIGRWTTQKNASLPA